MNRQTTKERDIVEGQGERMRHRQGEGEKNET